MKIKYKVLFYYVDSNVIHSFVSGSFDSLEEAIVDSRSMLRSESVVKVEIVKEFING